MILVQVSFPLGPQGVFFVNLSIGIPFFIFIFINEFVCGRADCFHAIPGRDSEHDRNSHVLLIHLRVFIAAAVSHHCDITTETDV